MQKELSKNQKNLISIINKMTKDYSDLPIGPDETGLLSQKLDMNRENHPFFEGNELNSRVKNYLKKLQTDKFFRLEIQAAMAGYDIRITDAEEEFWVLIALSYAKSLIKNTGKYKGHIIHIGHDCFYKRHNRVTSIIAYTLIKTGIFEDNGGLIYWGINDGGTMKHMPMLQRALTGKDGHWFNATVSHKTAPGISGVKFGMNGQVLCADGLMEDIFDVMVKGDFPELKTVENPEDYIVNIGDTVPFFTSVSRKIIEARTKMPRNLPMDETLKGLDVGFVLDKNPLVLRTIKILKNLGANVIVEGDPDEIDEPNSVRDPNETNSEGVVSLMEWLDKKNDKDLILSYFDPDGDRCGFIAYDNKGKPKNFKGTDLLILTAHNLADYNKENIYVGVVSDMRASVAAIILGKNLKKNNHPIEIVPAAPGYNMFHEAIERSLKQGIDLVVGIEETSHTMFRPYTSRLFGAKQDNIDQGGDSAPLFSIYLLGLKRWMWEKRSVQEQLDHIQDYYQVPKTQRDEFKPMLNKEHGMAKIQVAIEVKKLANEIFRGNQNFIVEDFDTGARIFNEKINAAVLIRHSKSGSGFTISCEYIKGDSEAQKLTQNLGVAIMLKAVKNAKKELENPENKHHMLKDFELVYNDIQPISDNIKDIDAIINIDDFLKLHAQKT